MTVAQDELSYVVAIPPCVWGCKRGRSHPPACESLELWNDDTNELAFAEMCRSMVENGTVAQDVNKVMLLLFHHVSGVQKT